MEYYLDLHCALYHKLRDSEDIYVNKTCSKVFKMYLTMFYHRVVAIRSDKCVLSRGNRVPNVAISANSALDTDVELPESRYRES